VEKDAKIKNAIETIDSPYDNKTIIESMTKRSFSKTGKKVTRSRKRKNVRITNDADIQREIRQHGNRNVNIVYDSDP
jgi:hypothetical protein